MKDPSNANASAGNRGGASNIQQGDAENTIVTFEGIVTELKRRGAALGVLEDRRTLVAKCPAHDDQTGELRVARTSPKASTAIIRCAGGCTRQQVIDALGPAVVLTRRPPNLHLAARTCDLDLAPIVAAITAGTYTRPAPTIGRIEGGTACLYPGKVHLAFGIGGTLKTWFAAYCLRGTDSRWPTRRVR